MSLMYFSTEIVVKAVCVVTVIDCFHSGTNVYF